MRWQPSTGTAAWLAEMSPHYGEIKRPVWIVSQADNAFRRETAERLHAQVPGAAQDGAGHGHYIQFEAPEAVLRAIRAAAAATPAAP